MKKKRFLLVQNDFSRLERRLGYVFNDSSLLRRALTHRSKSSDNNQRLEFLGDSILSFVIANALFEQFPEEDEGKLSRLRAHLVKGETLAVLGAEIGLGDVLILGPGELRTGGFRRSSNLADALEAVFAAIYIDGGIHEAQACILHLFSTRLADSGLAENLKDSKTLLQEFLQAQKSPLPQYELVLVSGDDHEQTFHVSCTVSGMRYVGEGQGNSRRRAEQEAAYALLSMLKHMSAD